MKFKSKEVTAVITALRELGLGEVVWKFEARPYKVSSRPARNT